jgi:hypothetical protein
MRKLTLIIAAALVSTTVIASALAMAHPSVAATVQDLLFWCKQQCSSTIKSCIDQWRCFGFIQGTLDHMYFIGLEYKEMKDKPDLAVGELRSFCVRTDTVPTNGAALQAFLNWAEKHPENWNWNASIGVNQVLNETWPCDVR